MWRSSGTFANESPSWIHQCFNHLNSCPPVAIAPVMSIQHWNPYSSKHGRRWTMYSGRFVSLSLPIGSRYVINPNQSYCGDGFGTIKPTNFREGCGSLGIIPATIALKIGLSLAFQVLKPLSSFSKNIRIMENPIKNGWFGGKTPYFWNPPIYFHFWTAWRFPGISPGQTNSPKPGIPTASKSGVRKPSAGSTWRRQLMDVVGVGGQRHGPTHGKPVGLMAIFERYTPGSTNIAGWKIHHEWVDVFPIQDGDFPAIAMFVYRRVNTTPWKINMEPNKSPMNRKENDLNQTSRELCSSR